MRKASLVAANDRLPGLQVWYGLSQWHCSEAGNGAAAAASVLKKACRGLPECSLLHYAAAELQESRGETEAARSLYEERVEASLKPVAACLSLERLHVHVCMADPLFGAGPVPTQHPAEALME